MSAAPGGKRSESPASGSKPSPAAPPSSMSGSRLSPPPSSPPGSKLSPSPSSPPGRRLSPCSASAPGSRLSPPFACSGSSSSPPTAPPTSDPPAVAGASVFCASKIAPSLAAPICMAENFGAPAGSGSDKVLARSRSPSAASRAPHAIQLPTNIMATQDETNFLFLIESDVRTKALASSHTGFSQTLKGQSSLSTGRSTIDFLHLQEAQLFW